MLAHHGIVFQPEDRKVWVSTNPYQMGEFVAYDLNKVFNTLKDQKGKMIIATESLNISEDSFIHTDTYANYEAFRILSRKIENAVEKKNKISEEELTQFGNLNPNYWATYYILGRYHYEQKEYKKALIAFKQASKREITTILDEKNVQEYIKKCQRKI